MVLITGYGPYLPHVGTSPSVVDNRAMTRAAPGSSSALTEPSTGRSLLREVLPLSIADQAREALDGLSLNKSQLAEVLGVSRPTLYDIEPSQRFDADWVSFADDSALTPPAADMTS